MSEVAAAAVSERNEGEPELLYPELAYVARMAAATHNTTEALAMREFVRLMELKVFLRDKDATKISPSPLMDDVWHAAILDTSFYASLQTKLGLTIHHRPSGAMEADAGARAERLVNLTNVYRMRYDEVPIGLNVEPSKEAATIQVPVNNDPFTIVAHAIYVGQVDEAFRASASVGLHCSRWTMVDRQPKLSLKAGVKGRVQDGRMPNIVHERARADLGGILVAQKDLELHQPHKLAHGQCLGRDVRCCRHSCGIGQFWVEQLWFSFIHNGRRRKR